MEEVVTVNYEVLSDGVEQLTLESFYDTQDIETAGHQYESFCDELTSFDLDIYIQK